MVKFKVAVYSKDKKKFDEFMKSISDNQKENYWFVNNEKDCLGINFNDLLVLDETIDDGLLEKINRRIASRKSQANKEKEVEGHEIKIYPLKGCGNEKFLYPGNCNIEIDGEVKCLIKKFEFLADENGIVCRIDLLCKKVEIEGIKKEFVNVKIQEIK